MMMAGEVWRDKRLIPQKRWESGGDGWTGRRDGHRADTTHPMRTSDAGEGGTGGGRRGRNRR